MFPAIPRAGNTVGPKNVLIINLHPFQACQHTYMRTIEINSQGFKLDNLQAMTV